MVVKSNDLKSIVIVFVKLYLLSLFLFVFFRSLVLTCKALKLFLLLCLPAPDTSLFHENRLALHGAKQPELPIVLLKDLMPLPESDHFSCTTQIETESHRWIELVKSYFLRRLLVEMVMILSQGLFVNLVNGRLGRVGVQQDQILILQANQVEGFLRLTSDDTTVLSVDKKCLYRLKVLLLHLFETKPRRD